MIPILPIRQDINNGTLSSLRAMPQKDSTSNGDSSFAMARRNYTKMVLPTMNQSQNLQKKWIGGNRDASRVTANNRIFETSVATLNAGQKPLSFTTTKDTNTARQALNRVRAGGAIVPSKVTGNAKFL
jgi:hypothetical protein